MKTRLAFLSGLLAGLLCVTAFAQNYKPFPGDTPDRRTLHVQERVEQLYEAGDYDRALLIYRDELAPLGDKYAQYMVGFMHLHAQGVGQDRPEALAWYRLAAERGEPVLILARDDLARQMSAAEVAVANQIFADLWRSIGDSTLVMELIRRDMDILRSRTGSRIARSASSSPAMTYRQDGALESPNFYRDVRLRLEARLNYLETKVEVTDIAAQSDAEEIRLLEEQVRAELAALGRP